jgi:hypothetical protein
MLAGVLVVDAANVIGSRPDGWWRDRPGTARTFVAGVRSAVAAGAIDAPVVVVLEGRARDGEPEGTADGVEVVHAPASGDDTIAGLAALAARAGTGVTVVTADRGLAGRVRTEGAAVVGPRWLLDRLADRHPG